MPPTQAKPHTPQLKARRLLLWLYIGSMLMLFAGLSSAYIVSKAETDWHEFALPNIFWANTGILLLSSLTLHLAFTSAKANRLGRCQALLSVTVALGVLFFGGQFLGYAQLVEDGIFLVGNPADSFVYVITGLHGVHLIGGIVALIVTTIFAFRLRVNSQQIEGLRLTLIFWHALDALWVYLFLFLFLNTA